MYWALWVIVLWFLAAGVFAKAGGSKSITWAMKAVMIIIALCGMAELTTL